jgi:hypothetical protein
MIKFSRLSTASFALLIALSAGSAYAQDSSADTQTKEQARQNAPVVSEEADTAEKPAKPATTSEKPAAEKPSKDEAAAATPEE